MANERAAAESAVQAKSGRASRLRLIVGLTVLLIVAGAGAAYFLIYDREGSKAASAAKPVKKSTPTFVNLENFTVNLADREHYLQVGIAFEVSGAGTAEAIKTFMPITRSRILLLLASKTAEDLSPAPGKQKLAAEILAIARSIVPVDEPEKNLVAVHFSAFVIQ